MIGHSQGDAAYHRCEANKKFGRCSGDCSQGRECDCKSEQPMPLTQTMEGEEIERLRKQIGELVVLIKRYRTETPLGHQPHMIAHVVDAYLAKIEGEK